MQTFDALIIGGGPAGATTALLLAEAGWSVAVVEKKLFPRRKVCGEFISATSLPLMKKLGLADFYLTHGGPEVRRVGLFAAKTILSSAMPPANQSLNHWGRALGREHLDGQLLQRANQAGASLWQPWTAKTLERNADLFVVTLVSSDQIKQLSARTVIIANGSWEKGLEPMSAPRHKPSDLLAFKAHFKDCDLASDLMPLLTFPGGYGGLVHSDNDRVTLSCCIRRDALQEARQLYAGLPAGDAVLKHIDTACLGVRQALLCAKREGNWLSAGPIRPGIRKYYSEGIFFVGNIAAEAHPVVAEGISMAMQSAWLLAQILRAHQNEILSNKNSADAGRDYAKQCRAHFANRIHAAAVFAQFAMRPWAVDMILPVLKRFPSILTVGAKLSGKAKQVVPVTISTKLTANETENTI
jgi:flavin-dependent dehydrogenase